MIFTVRDLGFEIGPFLLEGWWALAARAVCAAVIVFAGLLLGWLLRRKIFPACRPAAGILPPPPSCCAVWIARWNGWPSSPASTLR